MKLTYAIIAVIMLALSASPFFFLKKADFGIDENNPGQVIAVSSYDAKVRSMDPATCGDTMSASIQANTFEGLYGYHFLLRPVKVIPILADGMPEISKDTLTYTIKIKKGLKYRRSPCFGTDKDGQPQTREVVAGDFVLAFKRVADPHIVTPLALAFIESKIVGLKEYRDKAKSYNKGDFSRYDLPFEGVKALDSHTLQFSLSVPFPQLIYVLAMHNYAPFPKEIISYYLENRDESDGSRSPVPMKDRSTFIKDCRAMVGTGAYYIDKLSYDGGDIVMKRNPDFREEYYPSEGSAGDKEAGLLDDAGKRVPFVDVNIMLFVPEDNPAWNMFMAKRTDVSGIPQQMFKTVILPGSKLTDSMAKDGIKLMQYESPAIYWLGFNLRDKVLGNSKSLRQALSLAFDVETYLKVLFNDRGVRAMNVVPSAFEEYPDLPKSPYSRFDLQAARAKLLAARMELEQAGVIKPGDPFPTLTVDLGGRDEPQKRVGEFIKFEFKQIGLEAKIELNDWPILQEKVENYKTQIYTMGWHADYPDPENFLQLFFGPNVESQTNQTYYINPEFDKLFEKASKMLPCPERTLIYSKMVGMLNEDCPVLLLSQPVSFVLCHPWVSNSKPHPVGYGFFKYRRIDEQMKKRMTGDN
ncbi:MAG: hypothetical protein HZA50_16830 [Planctomycetes bacterium]|nr:hypothetical protein [Planctomycetota bacterium]